MSASDFEIDADTPPQGVGVSGLLCVFYLGFNRDTKGYGTY